MIHGAKRDLKRTYLSPRAFSFAEGEVSRAFSKFQSINEQAQIFKDFIQTALNQSACLDCFSDQPQLIL